MVKGITPEQARKIREQNGLKETKLQKLRFAKGLSQKQLSVISGVSVRSIQCYEQHQRDINNAHLNTLCDLCIALDCKITDIIDDETLIERYKIVK